VQLQLFLLNSPYPITKSQTYRVPVGKWGNRFCWLPNRGQDARLARTGTPWMSRLFAFRTRAIISCGGQGGKVKTSLGWAMPLEPSEDKRQVQACFDQGMNLQRHGAALVIGQAGAIVDERAPYGRVDRNREIDGDRFTGLQRA